jgi:xanthine/CO dehydrogenase XdhC/CoxF family maturation factor
MRELREILAAYGRLSAAGESGVLASVVAVEGSTYRRPGARTLMLPDESAIGLVSGGCLEGDLLERARSVRESGAPALVHYDFRGEEDLVWGLGLGCAGAVDVFLERVDAGHPGPLGWLGAWVAGRRAGAIATLLEGPRAGARRARAEGGRAEGPLADPALDLALEAALAEHRPQRIASAAGAVAIEAFAPPLRLALFGAGPDAAPVAALAVSLGWHVVVLEPRAVFARPERFPGAEVVHVEVEQAVARAALGAADFAVVMTHHYLHDRALLGALLAGPARYVAVLGPKQRSEDLLSDLAAAGARIGDEERARLFGPAGLDLGADSPEEIALAIVAEVQAVAAGRSGGPLRARKGPIHDPA